VVKWGVLKTGASIFSPAHLRYLKAVRGTMLRNLSGEYLATALDGFESGNLRAAAQLWQSMCQRDDVISSVKAKREKTVSRRDWQVLTSDNSGEAKRQAKVLEEFWNNVDVVNAFDRNQRGGFALLVRQMMEAVSFKYAVHHLVWKPSASQLGCTFEYVPLHFFENLTGSLRFCPTGMDYEGVEMKPEEWLVTCGDGLMIAGSIGYFCKRNALADWMAFSDKFGMPGILARTSQGKDTPGGIAMAEAAESFGQDWTAILFGDDGSGKIELITPSGGASTLPMPGLIERVDRRLAALWRGADLSSMSSSKGEGTGASVQSGETDILDQDDALMISERLNEIDEQVLRWWFGPKVKVRAYIRLIAPQSEDQKLLLTAVETLVKLGAPVAVSDVLERFGFPTPKAGEPLLGEVQKQDAETRRLADAETQPQLNAAMDEDQFLLAAGRLLAQASREDRQNLVDDLRSILSAPESTQLNALASFIERLPENISQDTAQVRAWEVLFATAIANGWASASPT
jgi:phage gp29-like protein